MFSYYFLNPLGEKLFLWPRIFSDFSLWFCLNNYFAISNHRIKIESITQKTNILAIFLAFLLETCYFPLPRKKRLSLLDFFLRVKRRFSFILFQFLIFYNYLWPNKYLSITESKWEEVVVVVLDIPLFRAIIVEQLR